MKSRPRLIDVSLLTICSRALVIGKVQFGGDVESLAFSFSLRNLCVLCVSAVRVIVKRRTPQSHRARRDLNLETPRYPTVEVIDTLKENVYTVPFSAGLFRRYWTK